MLKNIKLLGLLIYIFSATLCISQPSCEDIISRHLETTGTGNLDKELTQFIIEGSILQNKMALPITIKAKFPGKFRMDMIFNNLNFVKVSNGDKNWEYNPMSDSVLTRQEKKEVVKDFVQRWTGGLHEYKNGDIKANLIGITKIEDIEAYKLKLVFGKKTRVYFIDKLSYLLLRVDDDIDEQKVTYYRDYRKVGKYFVPFSMVGYEGGVPAISMKFGSVKLNPEISSAVFNKPKAG